MISVKTTPRHITRSRTKNQESEGLNVSSSLPKGCPTIDCACTTGPRQNRLKTQPSSDGKCTTHSRFELNKSYQVNVSSIDIASIEDIVFGDDRPCAETYVESVSAALMTPSSDKLTPYFTNHTAFIEAEKGGIQIGNYTYSPGGRWKPTNCKPKWKGSPFNYKNCSTKGPCIRRN
ncbi:uncharacterized protein LOC135154489 [Lytechinus pictus]|uniref:uncharacterized protein LOC135154489 n=1 Tax=Lytechinus pictus TaxID=7653 RepID=UPI0030BA1004